MCKELLAPSKESCHHIPHLLLSAVVPGFLDPSRPFPSIPLRAPSSWEGRECPCPSSVPISSDHTLLLQKDKAQLTDPTDEEVLVAALKLKEPTKTAYINNTFTTTDL